MRSETARVIRQLIPARRWRWSLATGIWTLIGVLSSVHWRIFAPIADHSGWAGFTWVRVLVWILWGMVFTPFILWLGNRFRLLGDKWRRHVLILAVLSIAVTLTYLYTYAWILMLNARRPDMVTFERLLNLTLFQHLTYYFLAFWATIGLEQAVIYFRNWHERELLASELRAQLTQEQLHALQSQVQPHFLFNALNTISSTILDGNRRTAHDLTTKLGELFRLSLERGGPELIPLSQELTMVDRYLTLMKARFEDQLMVETFVAPDTMSALVPPFLLQPLIENAVKHSVALSEGVTTISIRSYSQGPSRLILEVEDRNSEKKEPTEAHSPSGHGHRLTQERLQCLYGENYTFSAAMQSHGGMRVRLDIPLSAQPTVQEAT